ncbi:acyl-CoA thioester hydrolase YciA [Buchnera aphidicola (Mindarus keteleerifoliae)]|uniref:acyl-CoA thioester hydrolase YciA n=1 Tax=Buchnera aphidicola TaxID=9 RepID=UPI0031B6842D
MEIEKNRPTGKMVLRTVPTNLNTNSNGDVFGGWIMSKMDIAGAILAKEISQGKVVTVQVNNITFLKPVSIGDIVSCYVDLVKIGKSSISINIEIWIKKIFSKSTKKKYIVATSNFIYVAIDDTGKPRIFLI